LKKRKLVKMQKVISFKVSKGPKFALEMIKEETDLTADMLASYVFSALFIVPKLTKTVARGRQQISNHITSRHWAQTNMPVHYIL
jgi:phenylalanyl-tRNA synthetase alpha chain